jgi:hypothetical protein
MNPTTPPREVTYESSWVHQGPRPPFSVGTEVLNMATALMGEIGATVKGHASGYDVQMNEYDVAITVLTYHDDEEVIGALIRRTGRPWEVVE